MNGKEIGVRWKAPYVVEVTAAVVPGINRLELDITNTWMNRLIGDAEKPESERTTYLASGGRGGFGGRGGTTTPMPMLPAGRRQPKQ